jgi:hypothetical protein
MDRSAGIRPAKPRRRQFDDLHTQQPWRRHTWNIGRSRAAPSSIWALDAGPKVYAGLGCSFVGQLHV